MRLRSLPDLHLEPGGYPGEFEPARFVPDRVIEL